MYLHLNHKELGVYSTSKLLVKECYRVSSQFRAAEQFNLSRQIRRAAVSVVFNLAEGSSRMTQAERRRFFEIARGSLIEVDACLDVANDLQLINPEQTKLAGEYIVRSFKLISGLIKACSK